MVYNVHVVAAHSRWRYDDHNTCFHVDVHGQSGTPTLRWTVNVNSGVTTSTFIFIAKHKGMRRPCNQDAGIPNLLRTCWTIFKVDSLKSAAHKLT